jgi:hypothetical protein
MAGLLTRSDAIRRTTGAGADGARRLDSVTGAAHPVTAVSSLMLDGLPDGVSFQHTTFAPVQGDTRRTAARNTNASTGTPLRLRIGCSSNPKFPGRPASDLQRVISATATLFTPLQAR